MIAVLAMLFVVVPAVHPAGLGPYQIILDRNPFDLRPPSPPPSPAPPVLEEAAGLKLTGVVELGARKTAFMVREERGKPAEYLNLREGEAAHSVEVVAIDARAGEVEVRHRAKRILLSFAGQAEAARLAELEEQRFVEEHTRAHEINERLEREREARELAEAASMQDEGKTAPREGPPVAP